MEITMSEIDEILELSRTAATQTVYELGGEGVLIKKGKKVFHQAVLG